MIYGSGYGGVMGPWGGCWTPSSYDSEPKTEQAKPKPEKAQSSKAETVTLDSVAGSASWSKPAKSSIAQGICDDVISSGQVWFETLQANGNRASKRELVAALKKDFQRECAEHNAPVPENAKYSARVEEYSPKQVGEVAKFLGAEVFDYQSTQTKELGSKLDGVLERLSLDDSGRLVSLQASSGDFLVQANYFMDQKGHIIGIVGQGGSI